MTKTPRYPRIGTATDVHTYSDDPNRTLWLACLEWPGEAGLVGHSDADVAAHALADAILGAAGLGDLGTNFGTDRPEWAGASGKEFLDEAVRMVHDRGYGIGNGTVQVIGNRPRMMARLQECSARLSEIVGGEINVSAKTTDGLGFAGRSEGMAAIATVLLMPR